MKRRLAYKVIIRLPRGASSRDMKEYILDALQSWKGQLDPINILFTIDPDSIAVTLLTGSNLRRGKTKTKTKQ